MTKISMIIKENEEKKYEINEDDVSLFTMLVEAVDDIVFVDVWHGDRKLNWWWDWLWVE